MRLRDYVKEIIKLNIINYFLINKKKKVKKLNNYRQSRYYFNQDDQVYFI
jgi:hypothetical protein